MRLRLPVACVGLGQSTLAPLSSSKANRAPVLRCLTDMIADQNFQEVCFQGVICPLRTL